MNGLSQEIASPLLVKNPLVNLASGYVVISGEGSTEETGGGADIEVHLTTL